MRFKRYLAGIAGFEPTSDGVKVRCLTAWLYPSINECRRHYKPAQAAFVLNKYGVGDGTRTQIEPTIFGTTIRRVNQLRYTHHKWHATQDSNL